jgi:hypothetical protein
MEKINAQDGKTYESKKKANNEEKTGTWNKHWLTGWLTD